MRKSHQILIQDVEYKSPKNKDVHKEYANNSKPNSKRKNDKMTSDDINCKPTAYNEDLLIIESLSKQK